MLIRYASKNLPDIIKIYEVTEFENKNQQDFEELSEKFSLTDEIILCGFSYLFWSVPIFGSNFACNFTSRHDWETGIFVNK